MSVTHILGGFATFAKLRSCSDDDWGDRLCHVYSVGILTLFAVFVGYGQFLGNPIECNLPAEFPASRVAYVKSKCWIKNTYYIPPDEDLPHVDIRKIAELPYYQWVPIILLFMAFLCKLPSVFWRILNGATGINLDKVINMSIDTQLLHSDKADDTMKIIAKYIDRWLSSNRDYHYNVCIRMRKHISYVCCCLCGKRDGLYLTRLYLFTKILYLISIVGQIFLLNLFLGHWYSFYGIEIMGNLVTNEARYSRFPTDTLCDLSLRELAQNLNWTFECFLPYNILNEKIFVFIWFWFVFVAMVVSVNLLLWLYRNCTQVSQYGYVKKCLKLMNEYHNDADKDLVKKFADHYLRSDGIFVLRIVAKNSNEIVLGIIVREIWRSFKNANDVEQLQGSNYAV